MGLAFARLQQAQQIELRPRLGEPAPLIRPAPGCGPPIAVDTVVPAHGRLPRVADFPSPLLPVMRHTLATLALLLGLGAAQAAPLPYDTLGQAAPSAPPLSASHRGELAVYFSGLAGGYESWIGVLVNGSERAPGLSNHASNYGQRLSLGDVQAGDVLNFFIQLGPPEDEEAARYYSDKDWNLDGVNHVWASAYAGDAQLPAGLHLAFEDLEGGGDFNDADHGVVFRIEAPGSQVPEPASLALACGGLALLGSRVRRRGATRG